MNVSVHIVSIALSICQWLLIWFSINFIQIRHGGDLQSLGELPQLALALQILDVVDRVLQQLGRFLGSPVLEGVVVVLVLPFDLDLALTPVHLLHLSQ